MHQRPFMSLTLWKNYTKAIESKLFLRFKLTWGLGLQWNTTERVMKGVTRAELCAVSSSCALMLLLVHSEQVLQYYQETFFRINRVSRGLQPSNRRYASPYLKVNKPFCWLCTESGVRGKTALPVQLKESQKGDNKMAHSVWRSNENLGRMSSKVYFILFDLCSPKTVLFGASWYNYKKKVYQTANCWLLCTQEVPFPAMRNCKHWVI